jgi:hypothetical protein
MSAFEDKADMTRTRANDRYWPKADIDCRGMSAIGGKADIDNQHWPVAFTDLCSLS